MKTYMVGGAVRDIYMGVPPKDVDYVVVGSTPEEMLASGFKQVGADFPVFLDDHGTEYALARKEKKVGDGYNGFETYFAPDITLEDDLSRRDLTINAMAMDNGGNIIDPFGGINDINNRILRHVSIAFVEDPVRVLRIARFRARFGPEWKIADDTMTLCKLLAKSGELRHLTKERVLKEFEKALDEPYAHLFFITLDSFGALQEVFGRDMTFDIRKDPKESAIMFYARLMRGMPSWFDVFKFEEEFRVSTKWRQYANMYRFLLIGNHGCWVDALDNAGAYRNKELFRKLASDFGGVYFFKRASVVFEKTQGIGFDDLTDEQRNTLKGPEIGAAIKQKRREAFSE